MASVPTRRAEKNDVIQLQPEMSQWGALLCIVDDVRTWGVQCYALIPEKRGEVPSRMYLRVQHEGYVVVGPAYWALESDGHEEPLDS